MPKAPRHTRWKGRTLQAHLNIPADARHAFGGKKQFLAVLHTSDPVLAACKVAPLIKEWKARITAVRAGLHDPLRDEIDKLAAEFRSLNAPLDDAGARLVVDAIAFAFQKVGGMTALEQHTALTNARGDVLTALQTAPQAGGAINALNTITAPGEGQTPFLTYLEKWQATLPKTKTSDARIANVREFDAMVGQALERLSRGHVQTYIDDLLTAGKNPRTVRYKLGGLNAYWKFLQSHEHVDSERNPFLGRAVKSRQTKAERASASKIGFAPGDVPKLWTEAEAYGDRELSHAIKLAYFMGWRLEEICRLKIADVQRTGGVTYISGGMKTESGRRTLPVPSLLLPLVKQLVTRTDSNGYLLCSGASNKWGLRGTAIGTRFSKLKTRMGFDRRRSFHSLRHTYATLLARARVPFDVLRDLLGHEGGEGGSVTAGYVDESELRERLIWLDRAIRFDSAEPALDDDED
jgi:integrase